jgi:hypothetical protein
MGFPGLIAGLMLRGWQPSRDGEACVLSTTPSNNEILLERVGQEFDDYCVGFVLFLW